MSTAILKILLIIFCLQVLIKFYFFFFLSYEKRRKMLDKSYGNKTSATKVSDYIQLFISALLVTLVFFSENFEYISFLTGLYVGATLIQIYFHHFSDALPEDKSPKSPVSPIKIMSYAIQAFPKKPWKELLFLTGLFGWGLYMLLSKGFHLF